VESVLQLIASDLNKLETAIEAMVTTRVPFIKQLVNHIIGSGGKRVRPILVILSARLSGYEGEGHIPYAAIIEFIHTSTLLHDDVVDNAPTRRGSLTANTIWGNEASVLVGDFLFSKSFDLMVDGGNPHILSVMSKTTTALAEGEILELIKTSDMEATEGDYYDIIRDKTAVLFAAACEIGAILGKVSAGRRRRLGEFGHHLGMAFQLMDDILDYTSQDKVLGKHVGTDLEEGKVTLPLIHALRFASRREHAYVKRILHKKKPVPEDFGRVRSMIMRYGGIEYTLNKAGEHTTAAKKLLGGLPGSPYRDALADLTDFMLKRRT
jgi:octaprenyl-diphosphate synthase